MWYEKHKTLRDEGKVTMLGLIQEQHPDRCALFMQWKQMDFPILVDALNLLDVSVVPIPILIDEAGVVRAIRPDEATLNAFVDAPAVEATEVGVRRSQERGVATANRLINFGDADDLDRAIGMYEQQCEDYPEDARAHFRLGVAYRKRFDSPVRRRPGDFAGSIAHWQRALELNPNQYICRRRIQQYGPRLDKPYPFYDWVKDAREAILARGETPRQLSAALTAAEVAAPQPRQDSDTAAGVRSEVEPDPQGRVDRDHAELFAVESVVVRDTGRAKRAFRVHVLITPQPEALAKWNDEAGPSQLWIEAPPGWRVDRQLNILHSTGAGDEVATRTAEFELRPLEEGLEADAPEPLAIIRGYLLYQVCHGEEGLCTYLRRDIEITSNPQP